MQLDIVKRIKICWSDLKNTWLELELFDLKQKWVDLTRFFFQVIPTQPE